MSKESTTNISIKESDIKILIEDLKKGRSKAVWNFLLQPSINAHIKKRAYVLFYKQNDAQRDGRLKHGLTKINEIEDFVSDLQISLMDRLSKYFEKNNWQELEPTHFANLLQKMSGYAALDLKRRITAKPEEIEKNNIPQGKMELFDVSLIYPQDRNKPLIEDNVINKLTVEEIKTIVPEETFELITMKSQEMTYNEIASKKGKNLQTVRSQIERGIQKIRKKFPEGLTNGKK